jgi:hypothetical protein
VEEPKRPRVKIVTRVFSSKSLDLCQIKLLEQENELRKYDRETEQLRHYLEYRLTTWRRTSTSSQSESMLHGHTSTKGNNSILDTR